MHLRDWPVLPVWLVMVWNGYPPSWWYWIFLPYPSICNPPFLLFLIQPPITWQPPYKWEGVSHGCPARPPSCWSSLDVLFFLDTPPPNAPRYSPHYDVITELRPHRAYITGQVADTISSISIHLSHFSEWIILWITVHGAVIIIFKLLFISNSRLIFLKYIYHTSHYRQIESELTVSNILWKVCHDLMFHMSARY